MSTPSHPEPPTTAGSKPEPSESTPKPKPPRRRVMVTGAAGFIGARFVESCAEQNIEVIAVDRPESFAERHGEVGVSTRIPLSDFQTIVDRETLFERWSEWQGKLHAVLHLGACSDTTQLDVDYLNRVNLHYSQELWRLCSRDGVPLVYASSAATYGAGEQGYDDDELRLHRLQPLNPYGDSKQQFDLWALSEEQKGVRPPKWCGFKFFNVYGFGERHKGKMASVVLHALDQIQQSGSVKLFRSHREGVEDGEQARDFVWVDDVVTLLHNVLTKPLDRGIYNLGTGRARTFLSLVEAVFEARDLPAQIEFIDTPLEIRERYQYFTEANLRKLETAGASHGVYALEEGVAQSVERLLEEFPELADRQ